MTTMLTEAYDALRDAQGVSEEKARKAAEAGAAFYYRFGKIEAEFAVVKCMVGFGVALNVAIILQLFTH